MGEYRYVGSYAHSLDDGTPLAPGDYVTLTDEQLKANQTMVDDGQLVKKEDLAPEPEGEGQGTTKTRSAKKGQAESKEE